MANERLRIAFRHLQLVYQGYNVVLNCVGDSVEYVPGDVPQVDWLDITDYTTGLDKFGLSWNAVNSSDKKSVETNADGSNYDKGVTAQLTFNDVAYQFIYDWLLSAPCNALNAVEVQITDELCGKVYRTFEIKVDNLTLAPIDRPCETDVQLREKDQAFQCVFITVIYDNWQNWFYDTSTYQHPCFLTCIEPRPRLLNSARMGLLLFGYSLPFVSFIAGINLNSSARKILQCDNFIEAPLVRDYLKNVTQKCGLTMNTMFDDLPENDYKNLCCFYPTAGDQFWAKDDGDDVESPTLFFHYENRWLIALSDFLNKLNTVFNAEWYVTPNNQLVFQPELYFLNLAVIYDFTLPDSVEFYELEYNFNGGKKSAYGRYEYGADGIDMASNDVSQLYNEIVNYSAVPNPMLEGSTEKTMEFAATGFVRDGREDDYMQLVIDDGVVVALVLVAILSLIAADLIAGFFTATGGVAVGVTLAIFLATLGTSASNLRSTFYQGLDNVYNGAVRMTFNQTGLPRLLLWDGVSKTRAKVVVTQNPPVNSYYNTSNTGFGDSDPAPDVIVIDYLITIPVIGAGVGDAYIIPLFATGVWAGRTNQIATWNGAAWTFVGASVGEVAQITAGADLAIFLRYNGTAWVAIYPGNPIGTSNPDLRIYNYPMYFKAGWTGNLFDRFHDPLDNPLKSLETFQQFTMKPDLCCEMLDTFGMWNNDFAKIGYIIKIEDRGTYSVFGRIQTIEVDYEAEQMIITGKVLKRLN